MLRNKDFAWKTLVVVMSAKKGDFCVLTLFPSFYGIVRHSHCTQRYSTESSRAFPITQELMWKVVCFAWRYLAAEHQHPGDLSPASWQLVVRIPNKTPRQCHRTKYLPWKIQTKNHNKWVDFTSTKGLYI